MEQVFGDLPESDALESDSAEGVWYRTAKHAGVVTRVAVAPPSYVSEDYVLAMMPVVALAREQLLQEAMEVSTL